jgi:hypothetical protein
VPLNNRSKSKKIEKIKCKTALKMHMSALRLDMNVANVFKVQVMLPIMEMQRRLDRWRKAAARLDFSNSQTTTTKKEEHKEQKASGKIMIWVLAKQC